MRVAFAGTPEFAAAALAALHRRRLRGAAGAHPARPAGRPRHEAAAFGGQGVRAATRHARRPAAQPAARRPAPDDAAQARAALQAPGRTCMVVAAYGLILPAWVLELPRLGCLNIHASLLPRWRGAAPIQRAIEAGDARTGITIMQMDEGLDTGDRCCCARAWRSAPDDTSATLHDAARRPGRPPRRRGAGGGGLRRLVARAAAGRRRHLRAQDRQGRGADRLDARRPRPSNAACAPSTPFPGRLRVRRRSPSSCGRRPSQPAVDAAARDRVRARPATCGWRAGEGALELLERAAPGRPAAARGGIPARRRPLTPAARGTAAGASSRASARPITGR